ncbi:hypothetical protein, partial [Acinetobacter baumannii]|uniref:hypothetical protein n=1 Tax=Acinetobacter baumannii TaxID=470 RepID=UPI0013D8A847
EEINLPSRIETGLEKSDRPQGTLPDGFAAGIETFRRPRNPMFNPSLPRTFDAWEALGPLRTGQRPRGVDPFHRLFDAWVPG